VPVTSRLETDGVATILHPGRDGLLAAQLTFAVGAANEPLALRGVTHVIEHLAMFAARDTPSRDQRGVDLETTNFYASGTPDRVVRFLREVCTALGSYRLTG
jgi:predicted Zn-dependent peptidase